MTRKTLWAGALALATLASSAAVVGASPARGGGFQHEGGRRGHGRGHAMLFDQLNLTDEQKASFKEMAKQQHEASKPLFEQARQRHQELKTLLDSGNADPARVGEATLALHQVEDQLKAQRQQMMDRFVQTLTPEQKAKFDQLKQEREQKREQWKQNRGQRDQRR